MAGAGPDSRRKLNRRFGDGRRRTRLPAELNRRREVRLSQYKRPAAEFLPPQPLFHDTFFMTRPVQCIFRLTADTGRPGVEGGMAASTLLKRQGSAHSRTFIVTSFQNMLITRLFVHHCSGGALPLREKRSGTAFFAVLTLAKSKCRRFSRPTSTATHRKAPQ